MNILLFSVLSIAIGLQVSYLLLDGENQRLVSIAMIYWGAAAMLLHALLTYGMRYAFTYLLFTFLYALGIEYVGVRASWPFGERFYSNDLGFQIYSVPLVVPFIWIIMAHPVLVISRKVSKHWVFLYGAISLTTWDLFLEPLMVDSGRWTWVVTGAHVPFQPEIPLSNIFGWLLTGAGLIATLHLILPRDRQKIGAPSLMLDIYLTWILLSGIIGNLFFFESPGTALIAGAIFGALLTPYFFKRFLG